MKENLIQSLSLILCLVLLVVLLGQNRQIREQVNQLENEVHQLRSSMTEEVRNISFQVRQELEDSQRVVAEYDLQPKEVSQEDHALLADVSVTLKEWFPDTQVSLLASVEDSQHEYLMETDSKGTFTAHIGIPLEAAQEIKLTAKLSGGGKNSLEHLGAWSDISLLLPLQNGGGGWSGPEYRDGIMNSNFNIAINGRNGVPGPIANPRFQVYRNGELAQTIPAVIDVYSSSSGGVCYTTDTQGNRWHLECQDGDVVDIRFLCEDEYGLGYDFLFATWIASDTPYDNTHGATFQTGSFPLQLYWSE